MRTHIEGVTAFALFVFACGFVSSVLAGIIGIGAVLFMAPMLYFGAPYFGTSLDFKAISNLTTFAVVTAAMRSILIYRGAGLIRRNVVTPLIVPALAGSCAGAVIAKFVSAEVVQIVFAVASIAGAVIVLFPYQAHLDDIDRPLHVKPGLYAATGGGVGIVGGLAGAGGGFLLVPVMLNVFRLPTRIALSTAAVSGTLIALAAFVGRILLGPLDWVLLGVIGVGAYAGADLGTRLQLRIPTVFIRRALACVISVVAVKLLLHAG